MKKHATLALLVITWLLWSGHFDPLMLSFGLLSCAFVYYLLIRLEVVNTNPQSFHIFMKMPKYVPWLLWQIVLSNLAVAKILWRRDMNLSPAVENVAATQKSSLGLVVYANSVTLTPGTLSIDAKHGSVLVHALEASSFEEDGFQEMDRRVTALEPE